jgi:hypothetical protein
MVPDTFLTPFIRAIWLDGLSVPANTGQSVAMSALLLLNQGMTYGCVGTG